MLNITRGKSRLKYTYHESKVEERSNLHLNHHIFPQSLKISERITHLLLHTVIFTRFLATARHSRNI